MSDSVGKITLDLEVTSDIAGQVNKVSSDIASTLKTNLNKSTNKVFDNMDKSMKNSINKINSNMKNMMSNTTNNLKNSLSKALSALSNIKLPTVKFNALENQNINSQSTQKTKTTRGPPVDKETLKLDIANIAKVIDNLEGQVNSQRKKVLELKSAYERAFNSGAKDASKLHEKFLKAQSTLIKMEAQGERLGVKYSQLINEMESLNNTSKKTSGFFNRINNGLQKLTSGLNSSSRSTRSFNNGIMGSIGQMAKWMIFFPMIVNGIYAMSSSLFASLNTNAQFVNSLNQIKTNLMVAFTPIFYAILPAINALMSALAAVTQYIASFISALFGKTYNQSFKATQGLINAKAAMGAYGSATEKAGNSAEKAGKKAKKALGDLMGFDEINKLNMNDSSDTGSPAGGSGGSSGIPQLVTPGLDTTSVDKAMKELVNKIKAYFKTFNFEPLIQSFNKAKKAVEPIINNLGKIIKWFLVEILDPLAHWTISDLLPAFLNLLSGALVFLNPILEVFMSLGSWLWDSFLQPIASWTGGIIVGVLNGLANVLSDIGGWIKEHKPLIENFILVIGSFAVAWNLVNTAIGIWNVLVGIWNSVGVIATSVTTAFGSAIAFLTSPIGIAILAIGSIIAIGVLLYKNWDELKVKAIQIWNNIKDKFNSFKEWLGNVFATDWSKKFGGFGDILNGFLVNVRNIFNSVKQIFNGIIDFIVGVFTGNWERAWNGVVNIFGGIMNGLKSVVKSPLNGVISLVNGAISGLNRISVDIPDFVPGYGGKKFGINIPKIPYLAKGGIIDSPTLAMVGEAGKEAVVPLENNTGGLDILAEKLSSRMVGNSSSGTSIGDIIIQVGNDTLGKILISELKKIQRQTGEAIIKV